jgi:hypothetical protein
MISLTSLVSNPYYLFKGPGRSSTDIVSGNFKALMM